MVEGVGVGAMIFSLLYWILNDGRGGGDQEKNTSNTGGRGGRGFQKLKGKKSKIIIAPSPL